MKESSRRRAEAALSPRRSLRRSLGWRATKEGVQSPESKAGMVQTKTDFLHISDPIFLTLIANQVKEPSERWGQKDGFAAGGPHNRIFLVLSDLEVDEMCVVRDRPQNLDRHFEIIHWQETAVHKCAARRRYPSASLSPYQSVQAKPDAARTRNIGRSGELARARVAARPEPKASVPPATLAGSQVHGTPRASKQLTNRCLQ